MSASNASRVYGGVTGEERIAERRRKLIEAGMNLFGSPGSASVRVKDVIAEAGLTERYFYESFSDLEALFDAVLEVTTQSLESEVNAAVAQAPDDGTSRFSIALRKAVDTLARDPRMIRILFIEALGKGGRASRRHHEFTLRGAENFSKWSRNDRGVSASDPVESRMKALAMSGATSELLIEWAEGHLDITPDKLADFLVGIYWRTNLP